MGRLAGLNSTEVIHKLFSRLPDRLQRDFVPIYQRGQGSFQQLREQVDNAAANAEFALGKILYHGRSNKSKGTNWKQPSSKSHVTVSTVREDAMCMSDVRSKTKTCVLCEDNHSLWNCREFKEMSIKKRNETVKLHRL